MYFDKNIPAREAIHNIFNTGWSRGTAAEALPRSFLMAAIKCSLHYTKPPLSSSIIGLGISSRQGNEKIKTDVLGAV